MQKDSKETEPLRLTFVEEATGLGPDYLPASAFSWEILCSDHPMWLLLILEFVRTTMEASPSLSGLVCGPFFIYSISNDTIDSTILLFCQKLCTLPHVWQLG